MFEYTFNAFQSMNYYSYVYNLTNMLKLSFKAPLPNFELVGCRKL